MSSSGAVVVLSGLADLNEIVVGGSHLYWSQPYPARIVGSCPLANCSASTIVAAVDEGGLPLGLHHAGGQLYWSHSYDNGNVSSCSVSGGVCGSSSMVRVNNVDYGSGVTVAGTTLVWTDYVPAPLNGEVRACNPSCSSPTRVTALASAVSVVVWNNLVIIGSSAQRGLFYAPLDGSMTNAAVFFDDDTHFRSAAWGLHIEGNELYWADRGTPPASDGLIGRCTLDTNLMLGGCATTATIVAGTRRGPRDVTTTPTAVYWTELEPDPGGTASPALGRIMMLPK